MKATSIVYKLLEDDPDLETDPKGWLKNYIDTTGGPDGHGNPADIKNLASVPMLERLGFDGPDADIATSLFEYGMIWKHLPGYQIIFVYKHPNYPNQFDRVVLDRDLDVRTEYNWVDWDAFLRGFGFDTWDLQAEWFSWGLPMKLFDLYTTYGALNLFGESGWEGFAIAEDEE